MSYTPGQADIDWQTLTTVGGYHYETDGRAVTGNEEIWTIEDSVRRLVGHGWVMPCDGWSGLYTTNYRRTRLGDLVVTAIGVQWATWTEEGQADYVRTGSYQEFGLAAALDALAATDAESMEAQWAAMLDAVDHD